MKDVPDILIGWSQEGVQWFVVRPQELEPEDEKGQQERVADAFEERVTAEDAFHEKRQFRADTQHEPVRPLLSQLLGGFGGSDDVVKCFLLAVVKQLWRQPDL